MRSTLQSLRARREQSDKGFTLIELLVVVVIIGILIAIAIPLYLNYQKSSHDKATASDVRNAAIVMEQCYSDNGEYPTIAEVADGSKSDGDSVSLSATGCDAGTINVSGGTKMNITYANGGFKITADNELGHKTVYTYDSTTGAGVTSS
jgi:type IV pilus assembly protein PilA